MKISRPIHHGVADACRAQLRDDLGAEVEIDRTIVDQIQDGCRKKRAGMTQKKGSPAARGLPGKGGSQDCESRNVLSVVGGTGDQEHPSCRVKRMRARR